LEEDLVFLGELESHFTTRRYVAVYQSRLNISSSEQVSDEPDEDEFVLEADLVELSHLEKLAEQIGFDEEVEIPDVLRPEVLIGVLLESCPRPGESRCRISLRMTSRSNLHVARQIDSNVQQLSLYTSYSRAGFSSEYVCGVLYLIARRCNPNVPNSFVAEDRVLHLYDSLSQRDIRSYIGRH
jgi:hypothetical protein